MNPPGSRPRSPPRFSPEALSDHPFARGKARVTPGAALGATLAHILLFAFGPIPFRYVPYQPPIDDLSDAEIIEIVWLALEDLPPIPAEAVPAADDAILVPRPPPPASPVSPLTAYAPSAEVTDADVAPDGPAPAAGGPEDLDDADDDDADDNDADGLTIAERLQPRSVDARLWAPVDDEYLELSDEERARMLIEGMIQTYNDSLAVAQALSELATDWTFTDDQGRRWGLSPGRLHLGDFSVPLPAIETSRGRIESALARQFVTDDLARAVVTAQIRETWSERARAIRERLELERQQQGVPLAPIRPSTDGRGNTGASPDAAPSEPRGRAPSPRVPVANPRTPSGDPPPSDADPPGQ